MISNPASMIANANKHRREKSSPARAQLGGDRPVGTAKAGSGAIAAKNGMPKKFAPDIPLLSIDSSNGPVHDYRDNFDPSQWTSLMTHTSGKVIVLNFWSDNKASSMVPVDV